MLLDLAGFKRAGNEQHHAELVIRAARTGFKDFQSDPMFGRRPTDKAGRVEALLELRPQCFLEISNVAAGIGRVARAHQLLGGLRQFLARQETVATDLESVAGLAGAGRHGRLAQNRRRGLVSLITRRMPAEPIVF